MAGLKSDNSVAGLEQATTREVASLDADYERCAQVTRRSRSSFYYAFILLPPERRRALHAVYAFCRFIDDIADDESIREPALLLKRWREELDRVYAGAPTRALSRALADSARRFNIPRELFEEIINGVEMDLSRKRYQSWEELRPYCYRVASALGLICIEIFGYRNPSAKTYAENLGLALQLTNILRDIDEDAAIGRLYLPREGLLHAGITSDEPRKVISDRALPKVCAPLVERARMHFREADEVMGRNARRVVRAPRIMSKYYRAILELLVERGFASPRRPVRLNKIARLAIIVRYAFI